ncbi:MAG: glucokinase [Rhodospirillales bacterium]
MTGRLVADIGGTQARFAVVLPNGQITRRIDYATQSFPSFSAALSRYRTESAVARGAISEAAVAGAGPLQHGGLKLTNADWRLETDVLRRLLGVRKAAVINDLAAVALALPDLGENERRPLYEGQPAPELPRLVVGLGTGLGMALLLPQADGRFLVQATEAGHAGCLPLVLARRAEAETFTLEQWLSGPGLARLHASLCGEVADPKVIASDSGQAARRTRRLFGEATAAVLRDAALMTGALGGLALIGSVAHALADDIASGLTQVLADPHPLQEMVQTLAVDLILHPDPAFLGLARMPLD